MKTAMQELIDWLEQNEIYYNKELILKLKQTLEKEREQIINAHFNGMDKLATSLSEFLPIKHTMLTIEEIKNGGESHEDGEEYYNQTYNQNK